MKIRSLWGEGGGRVVPCGQTDGRIWRS